MKEIISDPKLEIGFLLNESRRAQINTFGACVDCMLVSKQSYVPWSWAGWGEYSCCCSTEVVLVGLSWLVPMTWVRAETMAETSVSEKEDS